MNTTFKVRIARKWREAERVHAFELRDPDGAALPPFTAGAHVDVHLPGGLVRQYSLCNDPRDTARYVIAVLLQDGGGSQAMHALEEGAHVTIGAPRNHFELDTGARRSLLVAGGIGITPLLSMAERLNILDRQFALHYCVRSMGTAAFAGSLREAPYRHCVHVHADDGPATQRFDLPALLAGAGADTHLYVCGPAGFIAMVQQAALAHGVAAERIHVEHFANANTVVDVASSSAFQVRVASTGRTIAVPAGQSVVDCLAEHGVAIPVSCRQGVCGSCLTTVLEGEPDHQDCYLTDTERALGDRFLPCCSRSRTPLLVLDL
ncbi:PDR/VanB family oxidoreductase [Pseudoduganella umbonata]|uniref:Oxidoreductase n=1 Tax=Pseudoduganella umbonata TaxID=864828 RepID=A0A4V1EDG5_9BURK|nr:PDR/VanB family oxidoreductase [Pseudoduganella umbonata]MBB3222458.1 vanillate O-demethylase ferredoxin subunit [Pseudoduganella umbonata]QCP11001.1 oxidoreductase [Pseudoduganella umbonata]